MYTRKDNAIRGLLIPVLVIGVPGGILALTLKFGVNPNITGLTFVAILVALVVWRIWVARHPDGWPLPKKVLKALDAVGFKGYSDPSMEMGRVYNDQDGFSIGYSDRMRVDASMNEKTRELCFAYRQRDASWLRGEDVFDVTLWRKHGDEPLVVNSTPSDFHFLAKSPSEKRFAAWVGRTLGEQILKLPLSRISVEKKTGDGDPRVYLYLTVPEGTATQVREVVADVKELFWRLMGAIEAERMDNWLK